MGSFLNEEDWLIKTHFGLRDQRNTIDALVTLVESLRSNWQKQKHGNIMRII